MFDKLIGNCFFAARPSGEERNSSKDDEVEGSEPSTNRWEAPNAEEAILDRVLWIGWHFQRQVRERF